MPTKTDPKDDEQKTKFIDWLDEWWEGKVSQATERKKSTKGEKGILDEFLGV